MKINFKKNQTIPLSKYLQKQCHPMKNSKIHWTDHLDPCINFHENRNFLSYLVSIHQIQHRPTHMLNWRNICEPKKKSHSLTVEISRSELRWIPRLVLELPPALKVIPQDATDLTSTSRNFDCRNEFPARERYDLCFFLCMVDCIEICKTNLLKFKLSYSTLT